METLLLLGLIALAVVVRRQAQRIGALERRIRGEAAVPLSTQAAARVILAEASAPALHEPAPAFVSSEVETRREAPPEARPPTSLGSDGEEDFAGSPVEVPGTPTAGAFEQIVGGKLPIWVGGAALAVAGYFLVRLAIESGLLTPAVRVVLASLFGIALLVAAEAAARLPRVAEDARVNQSLAGAGLATLYAAAYLAGAHYGLIGPGAAFAMMAAITALALALSLKRGAPTALMGLVGGFVTPLLAGAENESVLPLLVYLSLLSAGLFGLAIARGWQWLALSAAAGGLLWSGLLIATAGETDALAAGAFVLLLAVAATLATGPGGGTRGGRVLRALPLVAGAGELAMLVATCRFGVGAWGLYGLLSAATIFLAWRDARLVPAVAAALLLSVVALAGSLFAATTPVLFGAATGIAILFGGAGHVLARRAGTGMWWAAIGAAGLTAPFAVLAGARPELLPDVSWAALALLLALPPLHLAWRSRHAARRTMPFDPPLQIGAATAAALLAAALAIPMPTALLPAAILMAAVALAEGGRRVDDRGVAWLALAAVALAVLAMIGLSGPLIEAGGRSLAGTRVLLPLLPAAVDAVRIMLVPAALIAIVAQRADGGAVPRRPLFGAAGVAAAAGLYILWKQLFEIETEAAFAAHGFLERELLTQALFVSGWLAALRGWRNAALVLAGAAVARLLWFDLGVCNPILVAQTVGPWPILNLATVHFLAAAAWIERMWRTEPARAARTAALAALIAVALGGAVLTVRQMFHGSLLTGAELGRPEFYGYSAGGVLLAVALFGWGAWMRDRPLRIAGLGLLTAMVLKVFLVDAAALQGVLRIASFLGLGVTLIGIGWAYGRFLGRPAPPVRG